VRRRGGGGRGGEPRGENEWWKIFHLSPLCGGEQNMYGRAKVDGPPAALRGPEAHRLGGARRGFVETVPEAAHDAHDADLTACAELDVEQNVAFDAQRARLLGVLRRRLRQYLERNLDAHLARSARGRRRRARVEARDLHRALRL